MTSPSLGRCYGVVVHILLIVADCHGEKMPRTAISYEIGESLAAQFALGSCLGGSPCRSACLVVFSAHWVRFSFRNRLPYPDLERVLEVTSS